MKKLVSPFLAVIIAVGLMVPVWAEDLSTTQINDSTIITEENIYAVFEYLGLDTDSIRTTDSNTLECITVGELREQINSWKNSPRYFSAIA